MLARLRLIGRSKLGGGDGDRYQFWGEGAYGELMLSARELLVLVGLCMGELVTSLHTGWVQFLMWHGKGDPHSRIPFKHLPGDGKMVAGRSLDTFTLLVNCHSKCVATCPSFSISQEFLRDLVYVRHNHAFEVLV